MIIIVEIVKNNGFFSLRILLMLLFFIGNVIRILIKRKYFRCCRCCFMFVDSLVKYSETWKRLMVKRKLGFG